MRIDRSKLNTLLRSGLNPDIKTRKQLAAFLNLDPTSLTRWFSTRDRLGNPRYPVVPDRHVTKILQLFNVDMQCLSLNDEEFRQYCFELSLSNTNQQNELARKNKARLENALNRKLNISDYSKKKQSKIPHYAFLLIGTALVVGCVLKYIGVTKVEQSASDNDLTAYEPECWTGYSFALGSFEEGDKADPCHYGKLFYNALSKLKSENKHIETNGLNAHQSSTHTYIAFLHEQLENRRIREKIVMNIELGKSELYRSNYSAAKSYLDNANELVSVLPESSPLLAKEISFYTNQIKKRTVD